MIRRMPSPCPPLSLQPHRESPRRPREESRGLSTAARRSQPHKPRSKRIWGWPHLHPQLRRQRFRGHHRTPTAWRWPTARCPPGSPSWQGLLSAATFLAERSRRRRPPAPARRLLLPPPPHSSLLTRFLRTSALSDVLRRPATRSRHWPPHLQGWPRGRPAPREGACRGGVASTLRLWRPGEEIRRLLV